MDNYAVNWCWVVIFRLPVVTHCSESTSSQYAWQNAQRARTGRRGERELAGLRGRQGRTRVSERLLSAVAAFPTGRQQHTSADAFRRYAAPGTETAPSPACEHGERVMSLGFHVTLPPPRISGDKTWQGIGPDTDRAAARPARDGALSDK